MIYERSNQSVMYCTGLKSKTLNTFSFFSLIPLIIFHFLLFTHFLTVVASSFAQTRCISAYFLYSGENRVGNKVMLDWMTTDKTPLVRVQAIAVSSRAALLQLSLTFDLPVEG